MRSRSRRARGGCDLCKDVATLTEVHAGVHHEHAWPSAGAAQGSPQLLLELVLGSDVVLLVVGRVASTLVRVAGLKLGCCFGRFQLFDGPEGFLV